MTFSRFASGVLVVALGFPLSAGADFDPPGPPAVTDFLQLDEIHFHRNQDDGFIFDDESELCATVKWTHSGHALAGSGAGMPVEQKKCWDDVNMGPSDGAVLNPPFILLGVGQAVSEWVSPVHDECVPSASWQFFMQVKELDSSDLATILELIGQALDLASKLGVVGNFTNLEASAKLKAIGMKIDDLLSDEELVGEVNEIFTAGIADPAGMEFRGMDFGSGTPQPAGYSLFKSVTMIPGGDPQCDPNDPNDPNSGAAPSAAALGAACRADDHVFSMSAASAAQSYVLLGSAASLIDGMQAEPGLTISIDIQKQRARELVAEVARAPADVAVTEAITSPSVPPATLTAAQNLLSQGDALRDSALLAGDTAELLQAAAKYEETHALLAPLLHPTCIAALIPALDLPGIAVFIAALLVAAWAFAFRPRDGEGQPS